MRKRLYGVLLTVMMMVAAVIPVSAANTDVTVEVKATTVSVTVPSTLPIVFNEDGTNAVPSNWKVENNSAIAGIHLTKIEMTGADGWKLLPEGYDTLTMSANSKNMIFTANGKVVTPAGATADAAGSATFDAGDFAVAASSDRVMNFEVTRGAFTTAAAASHAYDMILTFAFNS